MVGLWVLGTDESGSLARTIRYINATNAISA